jgi:hypothetical protein
MKRNSLAAALALLAAAFLPPVGAHAAPLPETTAVQARPDPAAAVITYLKAGSEPALAAPGTEITPDGWTAVTVAGPFSAYVHNRDLSKSLEVKPGSSLYLKPQEGSGVLAIAAKGDKTEITGLHGNWTQIRLDRDLVGYIQTGPLAAAVPVAGAPAAPAGAPPAIVAAPEVPAAPGRPAPGFGDADYTTSRFPRLLEGRFVSTHNLLPIHRPYDWQLVDASGVRRAYLDVSRLLQTDPIDQYVNRQVEVSGTMKALAGRDDVVVIVENLRLQ